MSDWIDLNVSLPADGVIVDTKIDDEMGSVRNVQPLKKMGRLWFLPDGSMYVYYTPTHWKTISTDQLRKLVEEERQKIITARKLISQYEGLLNENV